MTKLSKLMSFRFDYFEALSNVSIFCILPRNNCLRWHHTENTYNWSLISWDSVSFWSSKRAKSSQNILKTKCFLYDACCKVWTSNIQNLLTCIFWQLLATFAKYQWFLYDACSLQKTSIIQKSLTFGENSGDSVWCLFIHLFSATYRIYLHSTEKCPKPTRFRMLLAHRFTGW